MLMLLNRTPHWLLVTLAGVAAITLCWPATLYRRVARTPRIMYRGGTND